MFYPSVNKQWCLSAKLFGTIDYKLIEIVLLPKLFAHISFVANVRLKKKRTRVKGFEVLNHTNEIFLNIQYKS